MTNEHLNTQLYWKLQREHMTFKNWLMRQPPGVIIANAYKYAMMEDVLLTFENNNLSDEQAKALLKGKDHAPEPICPNGRPDRGYYCRHILHLRLQRLQLWKPFPGTAAEVSANVQIPRAFPEDQRRDCRSQV